VALAPNEIKANQGWDLDSCQGCGCTVVDSLWVARVHGRQGSMARWDRGEL